MVASRCLRVAAAAALVAGGAWAEGPYRMRDVILGETTKKVKVRMFWIRQGQSCAGVMERCALGQEDFERMRSKVESAIKQNGGIYNQSSLLHHYGLEAATEEERDCSVQLSSLDSAAMPTAPKGLRIGQRGEKGAIIRVHDLYADPPLTDCARHATKQAGKSFLTWLKSKGIRLDFIGSSGLQRSIESALPFFFEQDPELLKTVVSGKPQVSPMPYLDERASPGTTSVQANNKPRSFKEQMRQLVKAKYDIRPVNDYYAENWPRMGQQYEKFKALLASQIVPFMKDFRDTMPWAAAPEDQFKQKLEESLATSIKAENHGKTKVEFDWTGGSYETGNSFLRPEYNRLDAEEVTVAFLGHGQMMADYCQGGAYMPSNNAVLEKLFIVEMTPGVQRGDIQFSRTVMRELAGSCGKVMDAPATSETLASLVRRDVATCQDPFVVSDWIGLKSTPISEKIFGNKSPSKCQAMSDAPEAYPILPGYGDEMFSVTI